MTGSPLSEPAPVSIRPSDARRSRLAVAALFLVLGFNYGTWSARLPAVKAGLGLSTSQVSVLLLSAAFGAVFSFPVTAALLHRLGSRGASLLSGVLVPVALLALGASPNWLSACVVMFAFGIVASTLDVAMNAQGVEVERAHGEPVMSRLHAVFSLGTMAGALFASAVTLVTPDVLPHFATAAVLMWGAVFATRGGLVADAVPVGGGSRSFAFPRGAALLIGAMAFLGMIVEGSMVDWSTLYLKERAMASQQVAPLGIASLQGTMLVTRWFGDRARARWGARRILVGGPLLAGFGLTVALLAGGVLPALAGFALFGVGVAIVSPCVYAAGASQGAVALASVMTLGSLGFLVGPLLIGSVAQATNLSWGLSVIAVGALALAALARRVKWD